MKNDHYAWVAGIITKGTPLWASTRGEIAQLDLSFEERMWLDFVRARLMPLKNKYQVSIEVAILVAYIMKGLYINKGKIISEQLK